MSYQCFNVTHHGAIAHVQLSRPEALNAMNAAFWLELPQCMRDLEASGQTRVIVISSTGKHFSAGMDLAVFSIRNQCRWQVIRDAWQKTCGVWFCSCRIP